MYLTVLYTGSSWTKKVHVSVGIYVYENLYE